MGKIRPYENKAVAIAIVIAPNPIPIMASFMGERFLCETDKPKKIETMVDEIIAPAIVLN